MEIIRDIDFEKYHTFFLEYYKFGPSSFYRHMIRPATITPDEYHKSSKIITLESAVVTFDGRETLEQVFLECAILGISIDFVDVFVPNEKKPLSGNDTRLLQTIDMSKEDSAEYFENVDKPRFYNALNDDKKDCLRFLTIDRIKQDPRIRFWNGKYDRHAVLAGFANQQDAYDFCRKLNEKL